MEKLLNPYDKEYMKMAMLKHEETFKRQVYELHRLYQMQKVLMKSMEPGRQTGQKPERWHPRNIPSLDQTGHIITDHEIKQMPRQGFIDLEQAAPADDDHEHNINTESDGVNGALEIEDEWQIELTLGPASFCRRKRADATRTSESGPSFSSSASTGSSHMKRTSTRTALDHWRTEASREDQFIAAPKWGLINEMPGQGFHRDRNISFDVEEQLNQDRLKHPPWLFQALSLNMT